MDLESRRRREESAGLHPDSSTHPDPSVKNGTGPSGNRGNTSVCMVVAGGLSHLLKVRGLQFHTHTLSYTHKDPLRTNRDVKRLGS